MFEIFSRSNRTELALRWVREGGEFFEERTSRKKVDDAIRRRSDLYRNNKRALASGERGSGTGSIVRMRANVCAIRTQRHARRCKRLQ